MKVFIVSGEFFTQTYCSGGLTVVCCVSLGLLPNSRWNNICYILVSPVCLLVVWLMPCSHQHRQVFFKMIFLLCVLAFDSYKKCFRSLSRKCWNHVLNPRWCHPAVRSLLFSVMHIHKKYKQINSQEMKTQVFVIILDCNGQNKNIPPLLFSRLISDVVRKQAARNDVCVIRFSWSFSPAFLSFPVSFSFLHPSSASLHPSSSPLTHDDTDMTKNIQHKETDDTNFLGVLVLQLSNEN